MMVRERRCRIWPAGAIVRRSRMPKAGEHFGPGVQEWLPIVLKYMLFGLVPVAVLFVAGFLVLARYNKSNAEAGPAPVVLLRVDDAGVTPDHLDIERGRLIELRLENATTSIRILRSDSEDVEQLPVQSAPFDKHAASVPAPRLLLSAGTGTGATLVRFKKSGEYTLQVDAPGRDGTLRMVTVTVK